MIDRTALLATLRPLVVELEDSIRSRVLETPEVTEHLEREHDRAVVAERTAMSLEEWRDGEITQAAVAWVLACVFVRFLEDNGLIDQALISGAGGRRAAAFGHREEYFRERPAHSDREYLEACFRDVACCPAVAPLYDERHNPLWRLGPTADGARRLRDTFIAIDPTTGALVHEFTDPDLDTRFLGDLYQDLSDAAKKRYALLQTPEFVERFILDRALEAAIGEFGLDEARLIDPTCGSGHFLIGAFERFFTLWRAREPATTATVLAQRSLNHISGVDLNPYATAIARFRLVIAALRACRIPRLAEAPAFRLHLATGDSLLHGPLPSDGASMLFDANRLNQNIAHVYDTEDAAELREILGRGYHAVVGNPPYIRGDDEAARNAYRARYSSCSGHFSLAVPFMERFFELAQLRSDHNGVRAGFVGKITANSFAKREFGKKLVDNFLPGIDIEAIVDTSLAYIPGHGTPTLMLFGRPRRPIGASVRVLDGIKTQSRQPSQPEDGLVWQSIVDLIDRPGSETPYIRASDADRNEIFVHPLALGIGREVKARVEGAVDGRFGDLLDDIGYGVVTRQDDVYELPCGVARRLNMGRNQTRAMISGEDVRDWTLSPRSHGVWPYDPETLEPFAEPATLRFLWPFRRLLSDRVAFGKSQLERGLEWFEYSMFFRGRYPPPRLSWSFVSTHNHFCWSEMAAVFRQTAPVAIFRATVDLDRQWSALATLNSSVVAFWLKQVCYDRGGGGIGGGIAEEAWERFYEFPSPRVSEIPLPPHASELAALARRITRLAEARSVHLPTALDEKPDDPTTLQAALDAAFEEERQASGVLVSLQEELDWLALAAYSMTPKDLPILGEDAPPIEVGQRAFEIVLARLAGDEQTTWFARHNSTPVTEIPADWPAEYRDVVQRRMALIESDPDLALIESPEHKRRWSTMTWDDRKKGALAERVLAALDDQELWGDLRPRSTNELTDELRRRPRIVEALDLLAGPTDGELADIVRSLVADSAVPHLAAQRLTEKGLRKREVWERVWALQRAADCGDEHEAIPIPPKFAQTDYRNSLYWRHRGKLGVPKERFVLIPNAERGADTSPVVGWAGWNERDLARALAGRITELRQEHAAGAERLIPLLAGVLELLPWIHKWHPDSDPLFGGPPGTFFEGWLDGELASLGVTRETLRAWRPPTPTRGRKATASTT